MVGGTWWASRARQVSTCERFRTAWLKSSRGSIEYVSCIRGEELSHGTLRVGFWNRPFVWPATRCISSPSTFLGRIRTGILFGISPEIVVLVGSFQDELGLMRTRHRWPTTVRAVAAVAAGLGDFSAELGHIADGVIGPSQWELGMTFPNVNLLRQSRRNKREIFAHLLAVTLPLLVVELCIFRIDLLFPSRYEIGG